jgi:hypothetical protein
MAQLRYNASQLLALIGGKQAMIESPLIQEIVAERMHKAILRFLTRRFGSVPQEIERRLRTVQDEARLDELLDLAADCPDLETFRARLLSQ